ncbi:MULTISPECIES: SpdD-like protein [Streptomyces]|uniref:SpdD-like protein n=1 Tax=Streptomyces TaxID=1883 RepID=UPI001E31EE29|nr:MULTISPECIES: SpdD-like protein [Streptomyces]UFQ16738.1 SpdD-like protein [Streptomyces huasconensis]WCL86339.1 SpdD-like protein [Streptomyces sp. JCM 35825]
MFEPRIPTNPTPTGETTPIITTTALPGHPHAPTACFCHNQAPAPAPVVASSRPTMQITPGNVLALVGAGTAVVLVVGAVLVSLLLAVTITAVSIAVITVVLRLLVRDIQKGR